MAIQYVVTEEELLSLLEGLELSKLRQMNSHASQSPIHKQDIDDVHRQFHYVTVRWTQSIGFKGYRA